VARPGVVRWWGWAHNTRRRGPDHGNGGKFVCVNYSYQQNARPLSKFHLVGCISVFGRAWWCGHNFRTMTLSISQYNNYVIAIYDGQTLELCSQWPWSRHIKAHHCLPNSPQHSQQHWSLGLKATAWHGNMSLFSLVRISIIITMPLVHVYTV